MPRFKTFWSTKKTNGGSKLEQSDGSEAEVEQLGLFLLEDNIAAVNNLDIVAIHGLGGHWRDTWTGDNGKLWLRDSVPLRLKDSGFNSRVFSYGYDSSTAFSKAVTDITDEAEMLLNRIKGERKSQAERHRPIIFIAHSLGGILVKKAMIIAHERSNEYGELLGSVKAAMFFGTPHRGSEAAYWGAYAANVLKILQLGRGTNTSFVSALQRNSPEFANISQQWIERAAPLKIRTFYETERLLGELVVDRDSARLGIANEIAVGVAGANHINICKFADFNGQKYKPVWNATEELAQYALGAWSTSASGDDDSQRLPAWRLTDPRDDKERISSSKDPLFSELPTATDTFYGRGDELLVIAKALDPGTPGQKGIVLCGIGGSGKTQLALRYIKQYQQLYTAVIWINASTAEHTIQSFAETADMVSSNWPFRDLPLTYLGSCNWRKVIARMRSTRYTRWLLVIDGIDDLHQDNFKQYIPSCQFGSIIVTSTQSRAPEVFQLSRLDVDRLDLDSGRELLLTRSFGSISDADISEDDFNTAAVIVNELHGLPLAIEQASVLLETVFSLSDFITAYRAHYRRLMEEAPQQGLLSYDRHRSIITVFDILHCSIKEKSPEAAALLIFIAILGPWRIPMTLMKQFQVNATQFHNPTDEDTKALTIALTDPSILLLALNDLANVCLLKLRRNRTVLCQAFSLHRAICQWCIEMAASEKQEWIIRAAHGLAAAILRPTKGIPSAWEIQGQSTIRSYLAPLDRCMSLISKYIPPEDLDPPDGSFCAEYAEIASRLALAYLCEGRSKEATTYFQVAIEFERITQGDSWPSTETSLKLLQDFGAACHKSGDLEKAAELLHSALSLSEKLYGSGDLRTTTIRDHLEMVSERREVMLEHHKSIVIAGSGPKLSREPQERAPTQDSASARLVLGGFEDINNGEEMYWDTEAEEVVDYSTELRGASYGGDEGVVRLLLGLENVDINSEDAYKRTPLSLAAQGGHEGTVNQLLARNDVRADSQDRGGRTPLSRAAEGGHEAVVRLLLAKDGVDPDSKDIDGLTPLSWAARSGHEAVVQLLLAKDRVDPDFKDGNGRTPLSWAAGGEHKAVVRLLLAKDGVNPDSKDRNGWTPLLWAAGRGHEAVVQLLLAKDGVNPDSKDGNGQTPLSWAANNGHEAVVKLLLEKGADVESKDKYGRTPLSRAAENGHEAVVKLLLAKDGVNPDSKDSNGRTPLSRAARSGHEAVVQLLLAKDRVDPDSKDGNGRTPLWWAARNGNEAVVRLLQLRDSLPP